MIYSTKRIIKKIQSPIIFNFKFLILNSGFTLIELLIAIAVVAMVMAVLFPNFMGVRQRARDTQRKSDLSQIQKALEMYKLDQNPAAYPSSYPQLSCGGCWSSGANCSDNIYMRKMPCDPAGPAPTYIYTRGITDTLIYSLSACLENPVDSDKDATANPSCPNGISYTVKEP